MESESGSGAPARHVVRVMGVPRAGGVCVVFAGPVTGILTHWHQGRSTGCPGAAKCPPSVHRGRTIWKGYAPVRAWSASAEKWLPAVLEITECLEEQLRGRRLVGEMWHLVRATGAKKSAQVSGVYYATRDEPGLVQGFDILPVVQRLYHSTDLEIGVPNPLPKKVSVVEVACEGPRIADEEIPHLAGVPTEAQREALRKLTGRPSSTRSSEVPPSAEQIEKLRQLSGEAKERLEKRRQFTYEVSTNGHSGKESK